MKKLLGCLLVAGLVFGSVGARSAAVVNGIAISKAATAAGAVSQHAIVWQLPAALGGAAGGAAAAGGAIAGGAAAGVGAAAATVGALSIPALAVVAGVVVAGVAVASSSNSTTTQH